jgi:hypothetical protein
VSVSWLSRIDSYQDAPHEAIAQRFLYFARHTHEQGSPLYARLSTAVAADPDLLALAADARKGQPVPNMLFAATHFLLLTGVRHPLAAFYPDLAGAASPAEEDPYPVFRAFCLEQREAIIQLLATRLVQTNEVARCACLFPVFGLIAVREAERPLATVEIGASAGLNLLWDRYGYDYGTGRRYGASASPVQIVCPMRGEIPPPLPAVPPRVAWRVGLDLNPIDVRDEQATLWLCALVWPEHTERLARLKRAIALARQDPPRLLSGDALTLLPQVLPAAPPDATLCVWHSFTINQFTREGRAQLATLLTEYAIHARRPLYRISLEHHNGDNPLLALTTYEPGGVSEHVLAECEGHGAWLAWREG